jgi:hypothetical protein
MREPSGRHRSRAAAVAALLAASLVAPAGPVASPAAAAPGSNTAVFIDATDAGGLQVVQTFKGTDVTVSWDEVTGEVTVEAKPGGVDEWRITMGPPRGDPLNAAAYDAPGGTPTDSEAGLTAQNLGSGSYTCTGGTFDVEDIDPEPVKETPAELTRLSISFTQDCAGKSIRGEIRYNTSFDFAAVGYESDPGADVALTVPQAVTFAGRYSSLTSITLKNHGTVALDLGLPVFNDEGVDRWYIGVDSCSGPPIPAGGECTLSLRAIDWIPRNYDDILTMSAVGLPSGEVRVRLPSAILAARFVPIQPVRLLDTRSGIAISGRLPNKSARTLTVVNRTPGDPTRNIPTNAVAVAGNLTITGQTSAGHAALTTSLQNNPTTSTLNVRLGDTRANGTIVRLTSGGTVGITWVGATGSATHAVFDATGYFVPVELVTGVTQGNFSAGFTPYRVLDSRTGQGFSGALRPNQPKTFTVPLTGVWNQSVAVTGNLTVVKPTGAGHVTIGPAQVTNPSTSTLNFPVGDTQANNVVVKLGGTASTKTLSVTYVGPPNTTAHVVFDVTGAFGPAGSLGYVPLEPSRVVDSRIAKGITTGRIQAGTGKEALIENQYPSDPSRNLPPDSSSDPTLFKHAITGNATFVGPTKAGHLTVLGSLPGSQPPTSTINSPAGDTRANGVILSSCCPPSAAFWYQAPSGGFTHVVFDVYGYFIQ